MLILFAFHSQSASWNYDFNSLTVSAKETSIIITGLKAMTNYKFRVIAQNAEGYSEPSEELIVSTLEEGKSTNQTWPTPNDDKIIMANLMLYLLSFNAHP